MKNGTRRTLSAAIWYKQILDSECKVGLPANKLCLQLGMNRNTLQSTFKKLYGKSIREYQVQIRMEKALQLLETGIDVTQVAEELNYAKMSAFTNAFTAYFGFAPSALIKPVE
ncbi:hypothetical protein A4D02_34210 [Niastella koreensis]|uniref:Transcriptional regulator, AraC family n=2 Tax=Niastella koreensis TaxID=354356 RepID=G8TDD1_NIAKG|nr:AraC family transcriptional regulator [Niastella koreensis]AEV99371.1 transcriptional regulator, AraC family [Niastella koreensis GR20-10]OQP45226.1 hypothetical protein A4D02_34210 [Niastella koreensis]